MKIDVHHLLSDLLPTESHSCSYLQSISDASSSIILPNWLCNEVEYEEFDASRFTNLESLQIGDNSFTYTTKFEIIGSNKLVNLKVGRDSFTRVKDEPSISILFSGRYFSVMNCERLESIEIGEYSFHDYGDEFQLSNLPLLHTLQIGIVEMRSSNFVSANFEVISRQNVLLSFLDLPSLKVINLGESSFRITPKIIIESSTVIM